LLVAAFTGLRASELRGLRWEDVDLDKRELHVRQRADKFNAIGRPKSVASARTVPLMPLVTNALREHKLQKRGDLVFTNTRGRCLALATIISEGWHPVQIAAGVVNKDGGPKYGGLHSLRHFYASWCINAIGDGGQGLTAKAVQGRLGHSTIATTLNIYSHLFPAIDEHKQIEAAEKAFFS
jgi:integrase